MYFIVIFVENKMVVKKFTFGKQIEEDTAGTKYQNYVTKFEKFVGDKGEVHTSVCKLLSFTYRKFYLWLLCQMCAIDNKSMGSSALNPGAVFLRFFTVAFLLFLTPQGGSNSAGPTF